MYLGEPHLVAMLSYDALGLGLRMAVAVLPMGKFREAYTFFLGLAPKDREACCSTLCLGGLTESQYTYIHILLCFMIMVLAIVTVGAEYSELEHRAVLETPHNPDPTGERTASSQPLYTYAMNAP